jgi:hypothetical protein
MNWSFLKKLDQRLLKNDPVTWSSRIHLAGFYGIMFLLALLVICFIVPDDPRKPNDIYNWVILIIVISLLAFVGWMIYLLRFNVFKRFGRWKNLDTVKTFFLYFLVTLLIASWPFIPPIVQSIRAGNKYSSVEMINDVNAMNIKICQLEKSSIDKKFHADTLQLKNSIKGLIRKDFYNNKPESYNVQDYYYADSNVIKTRLLESDSLKQLNDSVYIFYDCPNYQFVEYENYYPGANAKLLRSIDLFKKAIQPKTPINKSVVKKELGQLFVKYSKNHNPVTLKVNPDDDGDYEVPTMYQVVEKYDLYYVNRAIKNILEKKYRWVIGGTTDICWRIAYYSTLFLSLLVLIYRHTTRRTFFLSLLTAVVLSILTGLYLAVSNSRHGEDFFTIMIIYFICFAAISATIAKSSCRTVVSGIAFNLLVFLTAFMPVIGTALYYSILRKQNYKNISVEDYDKLFQNEELHLFISEIIGFTLLIVLLATIYRVIFRKWFALPDQ